MLHDVKSHGTMRACCTRAGASAAAGFLVLAGLSAAIAQSVEDLDLGSIKGRTAEQVREAQALVDAVAGRGDAHQGEAEDLRDAGLAAAGAIDPVSLPAGPQGPVDFDEILSGAAANAQAPMGEGPLFTVFVSLSMPQASLASLIRDTTRAGGLVVFRGFPANSTRAFAEGLKRVVTDEAQEAHIAIDPRLFRAFGVTAAPTFVVTGRPYVLCDGFDCTSAVPDHDRLTGNVTVEYALERFSEARGPGAGIAATALANLRKGG